MIEIEGDLARKTFRIHATGKVAWIIAIGSIGAVVTLLVLAAKTRGAAAPVAASTAAFLGVAAVPAVATTLGTSTTTAIAIAVAAGGIGALTTLRGYKQVSYDKDTLVLKKK